MRRRKGSIRSRVEGYREGMRKASPAAPKLREGSGVGSHVDNQLADGVNRGRFERHQGSSRLASSAAASADESSASLWDLVGRGSSRPRPADLPMPVNGDAIARARRAVS